MNSDRIYSTNIFAKILLNVFNKIFPEFIRRCPYPPIPIEKINLTVPYIFVAMIPVGVYKGIGVVRCNRNENLLNVSLIAEVI
jgi:hypothetical protein